MGQTCLAHDRITANKPGFHEGLAKFFCARECARETDANTSMVIVRLAKIIVGETIVALFAKHGGEISIRNITAVLLNRSEPARET